jgi:hypothetical protein
VRALGLYLFSLHFCCTLLRNQAGLAYRAGQEQTEKPRGACRISLTGCARVDRGGSGCFLPPRVHLQCAMFPMFPFGSSASPTGKPTAPPSPPPAPLPPTASTCSAASHSRRHVFLGVYPPPPGSCACGCRTPPSRTADRSLKVSLVGSEARFTN